MENFEFYWRGNFYWWSRSLTAVSFVFCFNKDLKEWCILANKRGKGCPNSVGLWNVPCGYVDCNETVSDAAKRETYEECGVEIPKENFQFLRLKTTPDEKSQNYSCSFFVKLEGDVSDYQTSNIFNEPDETDCIEWIPISKLSSYDFAFNQKPMIEKVYKKFIKISLFKKLILKLLDYGIRKFKINPLL